METGEVLEFYHAELEALKEQVGEIEEAKKTAQRADGEYKKAKAAADEAAAAAEEHTRAETARRSQEEAAQAWLERARQAERSVVANPRVLGTGVDVPEVDLVVMASPRQSHVDVLQMAGRATRLAPGKPCGYVLCPARSTVVDGEEVLEAARALRAKHGSDCDVAESLSGLGQFLHQRARGLASSASAFTADRGSGNPRASERADAPKEPRGLREPSLAACAAIDSPRARSRSTSSG